LTNVQAVVWGGNIQEFQYQLGAPIAIALFVKAADCAKFFAATANGIPYPANPTLTIMVEKLEAEPAHGIVKEYVEKDITRCVRVYDIDAEWGKLALQRLAQGPNNRVVERIVNGQNSKGVSTLYRIGARFCVFASICNTSFARKQSSLVNHQF
jgi:hypothetical protein